MENKLTNEQIEKARNGKTAAEVRALAEKEHMELTDEELVAVAGGNVISNPTPANVGIAGAKPDLSGFCVTNGNKKGK